MKPDKFDETIRQKLEGIQPNFQEKDWARFKTYQAAHAPQSFIQRFGRIMLYTAASLAGAVMVFANVYQYRQNQQLDQQLKEIKGQLAQKDDTPIRVLNRVDTVFITKYIPLNSSKTNQYAPTILSLDNPENVDKILESQANRGEVVRRSPNDGMKEVNGGLSTNGATENKEISNRSNLNQDLELLTNLAISSARNDASGLQKRITDNKTIQLSTQSPSKSSDNGGIVENKSNSIVPFLGEQEAANPSVATTNSFEVNQIAPIQIVEDLEGIAPAEIQVKRYAYAQLATSPATAATTTMDSKTTPPPSISFHGVKFRIGAGLNIGDKYTARSLNMSLLLGKYWSLDAGLSKALINGPQFYTEDIFKVKTKRDFEAWHKSSNPPQLISPQVYDIKTSVSLVRIPINLTYRWPIKEGFTLLMSGGTNINLSANQKYSFFTKERNGEWIEREGGFDVKSSISNDVVLAAGLEKQWRHLVFQGEAYAAPYLQKPSYLTENRNIGVRFRVLYQFGKK